MNTELVQPVQLKRTNLYGDACAQGCVPKLTASAENL